MLKHREPEAPLIHELVTPMSETDAMQRASWGQAPGVAVITYFAGSAQARLGAYRQQIAAYAKHYRRAVATSWGEFAPWVRGGMQRNQRPTRRAFNVLLSTLILAAMLVTVVGTGISGIADYYALKSLESNAVAALTRIPEDLGLGSHTLKQHYITQTETAAAEADIQIALNDFTQLHQRLLHPDALLAAAMSAPKLGPLLHSGYLLSSVAIDGIQIAQQLFYTVVALANVYVSAPLTANGPTDQQQGGLSAQELLNMRRDFVNALPYISDLTLRLKIESPSVLFAALSSSQQAKIMPYLQILPQIPTFLPFFDQFMAAAPAILGIGQPAAYLITTMDPAEMRATGGFQGNYAVMDMRAGRPGLVNLQDVYLLDQPYNLRYPGNVDAPPQQYLGWWPSGFLPWGLRDANLAPNFPTSAGYDLQELQLEKGNLVPVVNGLGNVAGHRFEPVTAVVAIEPQVIRQLLQLVGPVRVGAPYNELVTADNFEQKIHYYQLTKAGRQVGTQAGQGDTISSANKRFTALLARQLELSFKTMPKDKVLTFFSMLLGDLHDKSIQIAFSNPTAENFLRYYQVSSELYTGNADSLMIADSNISGNKASQYLHEQITDQVQLDRNGGATHTMTIHYVWDPPPIQDGTNPDQVYNTLYNANSSADYGLFYRQYVRIYTAQNPSVRAASGWQFGGIDTTQSDFPNRGMLGAYYILQGDATSHPVAWSVPDVTVSWYVPNVFTPGGNYEFHFQRQAGADLTLNVTVTPPACTNQSAQTFTQAPVTTDKVFVLHVASC